MAATTYLPMGNRADEFETRTAGTLAHMVGEEFWTDESRRDIAKVVAVWSYSDLLVSINGRQRRVMSSTYVRQALETRGIGREEVPVSASSVGASLGKALRPSQVEAVEAAGQAWRSSDRCQVVMACGTGKTLMGAALGQSHRRVLVLVPSLALARQTLEVWKEQGDRPVLGVASDETVVNHKDSMTIRELGLGQAAVTVWPDAIAKFLGSPSPLLVVATYQSSDAVAAAFASDDLAPFDLVIADEAHHCATAADSPFALVLGSAIPSARRLFMTATPRLFSHRVTGDGVRICSMDDPALFGKVAYRYTFQQAIDDGWLSDYRVLVWGIRGDADVGLVRALARDEVVRLHALLAAVGDERFGISRVLTFHSRVARAKAAATWLGRSAEGDGLWVGWFHGGMPAKQREVGLNSLAQAAEGGVAIATNCRCLGEGIDVPSLDAVAFLDPRTSELDIVQAVGRALRLSPGKGMAYVIVPVVVPDGVDPDQVLARGEFARVWHTVNALREHDEVLATEITGAYRSGYGEKWPSKVILDGAFADGDAAMTDLVRELRLQVLERGVGEGERFFLALDELVAQRGTIVVSQRYVHSLARGGQLALGVWLGERVREARADRLAPTRLARLVAYPGWNEMVQRARPKEAEWDALEGYYKAHGNIRVAASYVHAPGRADEFRLGAWFHGQIRMARIGQLSTANRRWFERYPGWLELVETWSGSDPRLALLKTFEGELGHILVPATYVVSGQDGRPVALGRWLHSNCAMARAGLLSAARAAAFAEFKGWDGLVHGQRGTEHALTALEDFWRKHKTLDVPVGYVWRPGEVDSFGLGRWMARQKERSKRGGVAPEVLARIRTMAQDWPLEAAA